MTRIEILNYAAGLFDGEGSVTLTSQGNPTKRLAVTLFSTTPVLLEFMKENFGGNIYKIKSRGKNSKPIQQWQMTGKKAGYFLREIQPYLKEPSKSTRARLVVDKLLPIIEDRNHPSRVNRVKIEEEILSK